MAAAPVRKASAAKARITGHNSRSAAASKFLSDSIIERSSYRVAMDEREASAAQSSVQLSELPEPETSRIRMEEINSVLYYKYDSNLTLHIKIRIY
uniref:Uncharacterized protein n=1 Tax=Oryza barthii TaxID=65489 RepID=A0A0D3GD46_9ORYZ